MVFRLCWTELKNSKVSICLFLMFAILVRWIGWITSNGPAWARMSGPSILLPYFSNIYLTALISGTLCLPIILVFRSSGDKRQEFLSALPISRLSAAFQRYMAILTIQSVLLAVIFGTSFVLSLLTAIPGNGEFRIIIDQMVFVIRAELASLGLIAIYNFMKNHFPAYILATSWLCTCAIFFVALGPFTCKLLSYVPVGYYACKLYSGDVGQILPTAAVAGILVGLEILAFLRLGMQR